MTHAHLGISSVPTTVASTLSRQAAQARNDGRRRIPSRVYGLLLAAAVAVCAIVLGRWVPIIGGPVFGIVIGLLIRNCIGVSQVFQPGLRFGSQQILKWSIIALGFGLSFGKVMETGLESLPVTLVTLSAAFISAYFLGKWLGIPGKLKILIGVGTAICGGSAIAAVTPIIKPEDHETAFAITTIFIFNIIAVLIFPVLGHMLGMSDQGFGMWAGTAINDTSSVVAAGYSYSQAAGDYATIVKLTRATLIIPICVVLACWQAYRMRRSGATDFSLMAIFPWFILWFVAASALRSSGLIPEAMNIPLRLLADFLIVLALSAIGLSSDLRRMLTAGAKPVLLGLGVWAAVVFSSLLVQYFTGSW
ncbi:MAG: putative sulfate exporter family transporter [Burkholderiaceae bacterium]|nr:putative sulfate exporter family transporter [Burkholderiaceae bacterium]